MSLYAQAVNKIEGAEDQAPTLCTCCDGDNQEDGESAKLISFPALKHSQVLCGFCAMMCGASRVEMGAMGAQVLAHVDDAAAER